MGGFAGFVLLRLRAHRLLVGAALVTILLTTTVLAALAGFTSGVADAGARRLLRTTDAAATPLLLSRQIGYPQRAESDPEARRLAARTLPGLPLSVRTVAVSDGFGLPGGSASDPDVTSLATLDRGELRLLQGSWPADAAPGGSPCRSPCPGQPSSGCCRPSLGGDRPSPRRRAVHAHRPDQQGQGDRPGHRRLRSTRHYQPVLAAGLLGGRGVQRSAGGGGTTYGPMLTTDGAFRTGAVTQSEQSWLALPDVSALHARDLAELAAAGRASAAAISAQGEFQVVTQLPTVLDQLRQSLLVARSTLLVVVLQLALLTVMTLLLAARLLTEEREGENTLLRARGAAPRRLVRFAAGEALLLAVPAAVLAPLLAGPLIRLLTRFGPLSRAGVRLDGPLPASAWWTALLTAAGCALVVVAPTLARARGWSESRRARTRRAALPGCCAAARTWPWSRSPQPPTGSCATTPAPARGC
ncbi:ABC transporter permease [Streptacidiphilus monticola]